LHQVATSAAGATTCGLRESGAAYCWGANDFGQLGSGLNGSRLEPTAVGRGRGFTAIAVGAAHVCALDAAGPALCWGRNLAGALGRGDTTAAATCPADATAHEACAVPEEVAGGLRFQAVGAGADFTCGLTTDARVHCWGEDFFGQLGVADTTLLACPAGGRCSVTPLAVAFPDTLRLAALAVGSAHACALDAAGAAWCWGRQGGVQGGARAPAAAPAAVGGGVAFAQLAAGSGTCALTAAGAAYCWGADAADTVPRPVASPYSFRSIAVGAGEACALTATGAAFCWALADLAPAQVPARLVFERLSVGAGYRCGEVPGIGAYCWGRNDAGQLGDGTRAVRAEPAFVAGQY
ncbi:MAG TPA: hypothetical protein VFS40_05285, partial [Gemmatimonadales bacterium]|nr:hypothetical protein [Gemmatimonadales bacterium]